MTTFRKEPTRRPKTKAKRGHMGAFYGRKAFTVFWREGSMMPP